MQSSSSWGDHYSLKMASTIQSPLNVRISLRSVCFWSGLPVQSAGVSVEGVLYDVHGIGGEAEVPDHPQN